MFIKEKRIKNYKKKYSEEKGKDWKNLFINTMQGGEVEKSSNKQEKDIGYLY